MALSRPLRLLVPRLPVPAAPAPYNLHQEIPPEATSTTARCVLTAPSRPGRHVRAHHRPVGLRLPDAAPPDDAVQCGCHPRAEGVYPGDRTRRHHGSVGGKLCDGRRGVWSGAQRGCVGLVGGHVSHGPRPRGEVEVEGWDGHLGWVGLVGENSGPGRRSIVRGSFSEGGVDHGRRRRKRRRRRRREKDSLRRVVYRGLVWSNVASRGSDVRPRCMQISRCRKG